MDKEMKNLKSIKGICDLGASILMSVVGDVNDFANEGKLAAYFWIIYKTLKNDLMFEDFPNYQLAKS